MSWITWLGYVLVCSALRLAFWPCAEDAALGDALGFVHVLCLGWVHDGLAGLLLKHLTRGDAPAPPPWPGRAVPSSGGTGASTAAPLSPSVTFASRSVMLTACA